MKLRGNLFIKIFLGFWLVTIAILGSWMLTLDYFDSQPVEPAYGEHRRGGPPHRFILRTIYSLQNLEDKALVAAIDKARQEHGIEIYLLDSNAEDLLGRKVTDNVKSAAAALDSGRRRASINTPQGRLVAHSIYRREQGPLRAVFDFQKPRAGILNALGGNPWLRICLAVLISGLVCFGLSRLMTNRLKELQLASRRLANGELDTRLQVRDQGGDETDELARDFNSMAEQLQERVQAQKRLMGDVSHELRSPLARLRIALALAQDDRANSDNYLARIEQEAERLEQLIAQLLASQPQTITLDTHIDIVSLLRQLCADANFEGQAQDKTVEFTSDTRQAIVGSSGDLLHKSFENILRNALAHTANHTQVAVQVLSQGAGYLVTVVDHGPGVPPDELETIFDEFYRVDTARTRESGGYGLGLAIARRAVEQHSGSIQAENTDTGLEISIRLPAHSDLS